MADVDLTAESLTSAISEGVATGIAKQTEEFHAKLLAGEFVTREAMEAKIAEMSAEHAKRIDELERTAAEAHAIHPEKLRDGRSIPKWPLPMDMLTSDAGNDHDREMQKLSDLMLIAQKFARKGQEADAGFAICKKFRIHDDSPIHKALNTYTSTGVSEWVPTVMSGDFHELLRNNLVVAPLFRQFTMVAKTVELPTGTGTATAYLKTGSENDTRTEDTASAYSGKVTWTSEDIAVRRDYSDQADQDSIVSLGSYIRDALAYSIAYNIDRAILDGDTSATHMDSAAVTSTDPRKAWIGLRKKALTNTGANMDLGTFTVENLAAILAAMGKYSTDPSKMAMIVSPNTYWSKIITLKDSQNNPAWLPANSPGAPNPVVTGQVATLFGIPVIVSDQVRTDLSQYGYYNSGYETDNSVVYFVRRESWMLGTRREVTIESDKDITKGSFIVVATWRGDFQHLEGSNLTTAIGYNVDV